MNGIEVAGQLRRLGDDPPIITLTADDWSGIEEAA